MQFWKKWTGKRNRKAASQLSVSDASQPALRRTGEAAIDLGELEIFAAVQTDVGCERQTNEDCGRFVRPGDPGVLARKGILVVVADGMGGSAAGEVASRMAIEEIGRFYYESSASPAEALKAAVVAANAEIYKAAQQDDRLKGMGTTCVALVVRGDEAHAAYIGDSRLYLVREGQIYLMTEDHSIVSEMVREGLITREEARRHDDRNVILRALGSQPAVDVAVWGRPLVVRAGDRYLLCSDGLHDLVEDEAIKEVALALEPHAACDSLVALAKRRGGYDNITVAIVGVRPKEEPSHARIRETREADSLP